MAMMETVTSHRWVVLGLMKCGRDVQAAARVSHILPCVACDPGDELGAETASAPTPAYDV